MDKDLPTPTPTKTTQVMSNFKSNHIHICQVNYSVLSKYHVVFPANKRSGHSLSPNHRIKVNYVVILSHDSSLRKWLGVTRER